MIEVVPVLDIQDGAVVRGVAGQRESYQPVQSPFANSARPPDVAAGLSQQFSATTFYIADLDAIGGGPVNQGAYRQIQSAALAIEELWVDAGVADAPRAREVAACSDDIRVVVGLESIASFDALPDLCSAAGRDALFSVDLMRGRPWNERFTELPPLEIAQRAIAAGFSRLIVLDLARVGVEEGLSVLPLCRTIKSTHPTIQLISGGGVRNRDDLEALADAGCDAALVATALHNGSLPPSDIAELRGFRPQ